MSRKHFKTKKLLTSQSLVSDFQTDWIDIVVLDNVGFLVSTSSVTANSGTFDAQVRMKPEAGSQESASDPATLTLSAVPTLADADDVLFVNLNQIPANQVRLSFNGTGVFEVQSLTFPAKASITDGDYIVITDSTTATWAIAIDTTGSASNTPTGAAYVAVASGHKTYLNISSATTAAQVAALVKTALEALTGFSAVYTVTDMGSGILRITSVLSGPITNPVPHNKNDGGAGTLAGAQVTGGVLANGTADVWVHSKSIGA